MVQNLIFSHYFKSLKNKNLKFSHQVLIEMYYYCPKYQFQTLKRKSKHRTEIYTNIYLGFNPCLVQICRSVATLSKALCLIKETVKNIVFQPLFQISKYTNLNFCLKYQFQTLKKGLKTE